MNATIFRFTVHTGPVYMMKTIEREQPNGVRVLVAHQHVYRPGVEHYSDSAVITPLPQRKAA